MRLLGTPSFMPPPVAAAFPVEDGIFSTEPDTKFNDFVGDAVPFAVVAEPLDEPEVKAEEEEEEDEGEGEGAF